MQQEIVPETTHLITCCYHIWYEASNLAVQCLVYSKSVIASRITQNTRFSVGQLQRFKDKCNNIAEALQRYIHIYIYTNLLSTGGFSFLPSSGCNSTSISIESAIQDDRYSMVSSCYRSRVTDNKQSSCLVSVFCSLTVLVFSGNSGLNC